MAVRLPRPCSNSLGIFLFGQIFWHSAAAVALVLVDRRALRRILTLKLPMLPETDSTSLVGHSLMRGAGSLDHARVRMLAAVERPEGLGELAQVPADRGLLLDQHDLPPAVRDVERRLDARDSAADDQARRSMGMRMGESGWLRLDLLPHARPSAMA
jgi:hypothetical protein